VKAGKSEVAYSAMRDLPSGDLRKIHDRALLRGSLPPTFIEAMHAQQLIKAHGHVPT
jgi:hypothetical protein